MVDTVQVVETAVTAEATKASAEVVQDAHAAAVKSEGKVASWLSAQAARGHIAAIMIGAGLALIVATLLISRF